MIRRLQRNRRGSVGILIALSGVMIVGGAAFGIDIGMLTLSQRKLQGTADEAALAAMASSPERRSQAIGQVLTANGVADASSDMILGRYDANPDILPEARFIPGTDGGAMRVVLRRPVPLIFGRILTGKATQQVSASAVAQRMDYVAFSVGSRAARAGGGLPGAFLNALAGTNLSLSLFDYQALASAEVELLQMIPLLGTRIGLTGASFDTILAADIRLPVLLNAMADTTTHPAAAAALRVIASHALNSKVPLNRLIDLGPLGKMSKAQSREVVNVGVYQMLREVLAISNGQRQFYMDLGGTLPGLTSTKIMLVIGDRPAKTPWLAVTQNGSATVQTSQMRMLVDVQIGVPRMANIELPIYMEAASARARRSSMRCWESTPSVTIESIPSPGSIAIAQIDRSRLEDMRQSPIMGPATLLQIWPAKVTGWTQINLSTDTAWQRVAFSAAEIRNGTTKTITANSAAQGYASSLLHRMDLRVEAGGRGVGFRRLPQVVGAALMPVAPTLDMLMSTISDLMGMHIGQADLTVDGARCGAASLVA